MMAAGSSVATWALLCYLKGTQMSITSDRPGDSREPTGELIQQPLPQTEQQAPPEDDQIVRPRPHPSNYPSHVEVRSALQRETPTDSDTA
jgi:hypothetical protein